MKKPINWWKFGAKSIGRSSRKVALREEQKASDKLMETGITAAVDDL